MRKTNILYIHGYNGSVNGASAKAFKKYLDKDKYTFYAVDYEQDDCQEALQEIRRQIVDKNIDLVIGTSLGGFLALNCWGVPRIIHNVCYSPSTELGALGMSEDSLKTYAEAEKKMKQYIDQEERHLVHAFVTDADELLKGRYIKTYIKEWNLPDMIKGGHQLSELSIKDVIIPYIDFFLDKCSQYADSLEAKDNAAFWDSLIMC